MPLTELNIKYVRNIKQLSVDLHNNINIFLGENGSGKSSLLESIYFMFMGRSFRTHRVSDVIQFGKDYCLVAGSIHTDHLDRPLSVGLQKKVGGDIDARIGGDRHTSIAPVAKLLPIQFHSPEDPLIVDAPAEVKRRFIDWGVFHVEHSFHDVWRSANKVLKQRNAYLKILRGRSTSQRATRIYRELEAWNRQLAELYEKIDRMRKAHVAKIMLHCESGPFSKRLSDLGVSIKYYSGWPSDESSLFDCLQASIERDIERGYTQYGAHRADLKIRLSPRRAVISDCMSDTNDINDEAPISKKMKGEGVKSAKSTLSRGQKKAISLHLKMIQAKIVGEQKGQRAVFLLDDIGAEFDNSSVNTIITWLIEQDIQLFITAINDDQLKHSLKGSNFNMFHVEHGQCVQKEHLNEVAFA